MAEFWHPTGLLDELCMTLSPKLVGSDAHRILRGPDINPVTPLELVDLCEADGFLFLRYCRKSGPAG